MSMRDYWPSVLQAQKAHFKIWREHILHRSIYDTVWTLKSLSWFILEPIWAFPPPSSKRCNFESNIAIDLHLRHVQVSPIAAFKCIFTIHSCITVNLYYIEIVVRSRRHQLTWVQTFSVVQLHSYIAVGLFPSVIYILNLLWFALFRRLVMSTVGFEKSSDQLLHFADSR